MILRKVLYSVYIIFHIFTNLINSVICGIHNQISNHIFDHKVKDSIYILTATIGYNLSILTLYSQSMNLAYPVITEQCKKSYQNLYLKHYNALQVSKFQFVLHAKSIVTVSSIAQWQNAGCECVRSRVNPQSRTASFQRRYKNGISSSLVQHSTLKREILALSQDLR